MYLLFPFPNHFPLTSTMFSRSRERWAWEPMRTRKEKIGLLRIQTLDWSPGFPLKTQWAVQTGIFAAGLVLDIFLWGREDLNQFPKTWSTRSAALKYDCCGCDRTAYLMEFEKTFSDQVHTWHEWMADSSTVLSLCWNSSVPYAKQVFRGGLTYCISSGIILVLWRNCSGQLISALFCSAVHT